MPCNLSLRFAFSCLLSSHDCAFSFASFHFPSSLPCVLIFLSFFLGFPPCLLFAMFHFSFSVALPLVSLSFIFSTLAPVPHPLISSSRPNPCHLIFPFSLFSLTPSHPAPSYRKRMLSLARLVSGRSLDSCSRWRCAATLHGTKALARRTAAKTATRTFCPVRSGLRGLGLGLGEGVCVWGGGEGAIEREDVYGECLSESEEVRQ